ncbi:competence protein ComGB [Alkalihalobacillus xiaoxiensis]|uniref:Competence protein ComGB n=1 Tax=Shouchella xiaoxiensis TaxID=766895 RepID=A0ABS2T1J3_9BACI|nr:competence type IV pilus assembly protein ComGB [Shouchella xiaoxiensis]MBM7840342.1 competence protein ComGB [Shouchella xiaoxiensis]
MKIKKKIRSTDEHILFIRRLGELLSKGYEIEQALRFLHVQASSNLQANIEFIRNELKRGSSVCASLNSLNLAGEIQSFIYFYEEQGRLAEGLVEAAHLAQKRTILKKQFQKLLRYPVFLIWGVVIALIIVNQFIVPHFISLFQTMQNSPPLLTRLFFSFLSIFPYVALFLFIVGAICAYIITQKYKTKSAHEKMAVLLKLNQSKIVVQQLVSYFFSMQLGRLLSTGMTIQQALSIFEKQNYLAFFRQEAYYMRTALMKGDALFTYIGNRDYYTNELAIIVENGMKTGKVAEDLQYYSQWLFQEIEETIQKRMAIMQPFLLIGVGGFILMLFLVVMLPMYEMIDSM